MKKKKSILHLCEATFLMLLLILASALYLLKYLLFDEVKIDRKFLGDALTENARIVLQEVFHMLKRMG